MVIHSILDEIKKNGIDHEFSIVKTLVSITKKQKLEIFLYIFLQFLKNSIICVDKDQILFRQKINIDFVICRFVNKAKNWLRNKQRTNQSQRRKTKHEQQLIKV